MLKKRLIILSMFLLIIGICTSVLAANTEDYITTTTINGVTVKWEYNLNSSNQIINLKCINPLELKGSITIPSTLEGKTVYSLSNEAFKKANNVTEFILPSSVKKIGYSAFENCTALSKVNLGSIEDISFNVFKGCTNLTSITIPKTLKTGATAPCLNNTNITKITLEEGLTVIPSYLCANTGITEITIPSSVKEIGYSAFDNCTKLNKITILDNVTDMGFYTIYDSKDSIFANHNENLTIYCYKNSLAANYAIKYNIKYAYLTKEEDKNNTVSNTTTNNTVSNTTKNNTVSDTTKNNTTSTNNTVKDTTIKGGVLPKTGIGFGLIITIVSLVGGGVFTYFKYNNLKDIK